MRCNCKTVRTGEEVVKLDKKLWKTSKEVGWKQIILPFTPCRSLHNSHRASNENKVPQNDFLDDVDVDDGEGLAVKIQPFFIIL